MGTLRDRLKEAPIEEREKILHADARYNELRAEGRPNDSYERLAYWNKLFFYGHIVSGCSDPRTGHSRSTAKHLGLPFTPCIHCEHKDDV